MYFSGLASGSGAISRSSLESSTSALLDVKFEELPRNGLRDAVRTVIFLISGILNRSEGDSEGGVGRGLGVGESEGRERSRCFVVDIGSSFCELIIVGQVTIAAIF